MKTIYFHGNPGGPGELALLGGEGVRSWLAPDRAKLPLSPDARINLLADIVSEACSGAPCRLVGFSAGAFAALQVSARRPDLDLVLDLVSPAGPLETGAYLDRMAGGALFRAAMQKPRLFAAFVNAQALGARWCPGLLTRALFASAQGEDRALVSDRSFSRAYGKVLRSCLIEGRESYRAEIAAYVCPWADVLSGVRHPVTIWQGTSDNWTPPDMAQALAQRLPNLHALHMLSGLSHFSALRAALAPLA